MDIREFMHNIQNVIYHYEELDDVAALNEIMQACFRAGALAGHASGLMDSDISHAAYPAIEVMSIHWRKYQDRKGQPERAETTQKKLG